MGFQSWEGIPDTGGVPDRNGGQHTGMVGFLTGDGIPDAGGVPDMGWGVSDRGWWGALQRCGIKIIESPKWNSSFPDL